MQKITPFLWFDNNAEEAVNFYVSVFQDSKIHTITRYGKDASGSEGAVMTISFSLQGQPFVALNGGPHLKITPAISFVVNCETQEELDAFWDKFSEGGRDMQCGWVTDKFGVSWQIVPSVLEEKLLSGEEEKSSRVMNELMKMTKLDIGTLKAAFDGGA